MVNLRSLSEMTRRGHWIAQERLKLLRAERRAMVSRSVEGPFNPFQRMSPEMITCIGTYLFTSFCNTYANRYIRSCTACSGFVMKGEPYRCIQAPLIIRGSISTDWDTVYAHTYSDLRLFMNSYLSASTVVLDFILMDDQTLMNISEYTGCSALQIRIDAGMRTLPSLRGNDNITTLFLQGEYDARRALTDLSAMLDLPNLRDLMVADCTWNQGFLNHAPNLCRLIVFKGRHKILDIDLIHRTRKRDGASLRRVSVNSRKRSY
jgi:hypothetical protein